MTALANETPDAPRRSGPYKVDAQRGAHSGDLSAQWYRRPADQRFLSLQSLYDFVKLRGDSSRAATVETRDIEVIADVTDPRTLKLRLPTEEAEVQPTHWAFGQLSSTAGAPAGYLRKLPAPLAAMNLQYGLMNNSTELAKVFVTDASLRAVTSPSYGRVLDSTVVEQVMSFATPGSGWKVPGVMDWGSGMYDPSVPVTSETTSLFASDRDVFLFLCRDEFPIEVGTLSDGNPDLLFPGFMVSNSETGSRTLTIETMYLRAVCENRNLWGIENHRSVKIRHTRLAPERFAEEAAPALEQFAKEAAAPVVALVKAAKAQTVGDDDDEVRKFLLKQKLAHNAVRDMMAQAEAEEGHPVRSIWDVCQCLTMHARDIKYQDDRVELERRAGALMEAVTV